MDSAWHFLGLCQNESEYWYPVWLLKKQNEWNKYADLIQLSFEQIKCLYTNTSFDKITKKLPVLLLKTAHAQCNCQLRLINQNTYFL